MRLKHYFKFYAAVVLAASRACRCRRTPSSAAATIVFDPIDVRPPAAAACSRKPPPSPTWLSSSST